jgi:hypothetical protein
MTAKVQMPAQFVRDFMTMTKHYLFTKEETEEAKVCAREHPEDAAMSYAAQSKLLAKSKEGV